MGIVGVAKGLRGEVPPEHDGLVDAVHVHVLHDAAAVGVVGEPGVLPDDLVEAGYGVNVRVHVHVLDEFADEGDEVAEEVELSVLDALWGSGSQKEYLSAAGAKL